MEQVVKTLGSTRQSQRATFLPESRGEGVYRGKQEKHSQEHYRFPRRSSEIGEMVGESVIGDRRQRPRHRLPEVAQCPAGDDQIDGKDEEAGKHPEESHHFPRRTFRIESRESLLGSITRPATDNKLRHQQYHTNEEDEKQVDKKAGGTAVLPTDVGETPDVAQSHCRPGGSHHHPKRGGKTGFVVCHSVRLVKNVETRREHVSTERESLLIIHP